MQIKLCRKSIFGDVISGELLIDGKRVCDTAENANGALPAGTYAVRLLHCRQYGRKMICLHPHPPCGKCRQLRFCGNNTILPCYCPMLKPGNGVCKRLDGSIVVGQQGAPGCILHPRKTFDALFQRLRKHTARGNEVTLSIINSPPAARFSCFLC